MKTTLFEKNVREKKVNVSLSNVSFAIYSAKVADFNVKSFNILSLNNELERLIWKVKLNISVATMKVTLSWAFLLPAYIFFLAAGFMGILWSILQKKKETFDNVSYFSIFAVLLYEFHQMLCFVTQCFILFLQYSVSVVW